MTDKEIKKILNAEEKEKIFTEEQKYNLYEYFNIYDIEDIGKISFKIPKQPLILNSPRPKKSKALAKPAEDVRKILSPLEEVFFDSELLDDLIIHTSIPQLLRGETPIFRGTILYGPPGTGKSEFQKATCRVYENAGAYSKQVSTSEVNSFFVGQFAKNLEAELELAQRQASMRGLPALLCFDEGSILAEKAQSGATSVSKHYQEAIDTLKRYIGNDCGSWLVLSISTNQLPEDFEEAMTREGRLATFYIGNPSQEQIARMWRHFLSKHQVLTLDESQAKSLSDLTPNETGAFIEEFARGYVPQRRKALLIQKGYSSMLEALRDGKSFPEQEVRDSITYGTFIADLKSYLQRLIERKNNGKTPPTDMGFHAILRDSH